MGRNKYEIPDYPFITTDYMRKRYGRFDPNVFKRWERGNKVQKIRNGLYHNEAYEIIGSVGMFSIANQIYDPSYVSTISALRYWNLIPETVYSVSSVTTKKTQQFEYNSTRFNYQTISPKLFFGYEVVKWSGLPYRIATKEKALLDLAYLEPLFKDPDWLYEMRFDSDVLHNELDWYLMFAYADQMGSKRVFNNITKLLEVYEV